MKASIFLFHRVSPLRDKLWDPLSPQKFEAIIQYLKKTFEIRHAEELLREKEILTTKAKPFAAIVFDDGYKDYIDYALPLLNKHSLPSSMYIVTSCADEGIPPWTYVLDNAFATTSKKQISIDASLLPEKLKKSSWSSDAEKIEFAKQFKPWLKQVNDSTRRTIVNQTLGSLNDTEIPANLMMTWKDIMEIKASGTIIGSHTVSHPLLSKIENEADIEHELHQSAQKIKEKTGTAPQTISYPIGSYDERVKKLAMKTGYQFGLAVRQDKYDSTRDDIYEVPRIELYNESMLKTKLRINGALEKIKKVLR